MTVPLLPGPFLQRVSGAVMLSEELQLVIHQTARQRVDRPLGVISGSHLLFTVAEFRWSEVVAQEEMRLVKKRLEAVQSAGVCDGRDGAPRAATHAVQAMYSILFVFVFNA